MILFSTATDRISVNKRLVVSVELASVLPSCSDIVLFGVDRSWSARVFLDSCSLFFLPSARTGRCGLLKVGVFGALRCACCLVGQSPTPQRRLQHTSHMTQHTPHTTTTNTHDINNTHAAHSITFATPQHNNNTTAQQHFRTAKFQCHNNITTPRRTSQHQTTQPAHRTTHNQLTNSRLRRKTTWRGRRDPTTR